MRGQKERMCVYVCCLVLYFVLGFTFIFESFARLLVSIANCVCISQSVSQSVFWASSCTEESGSRHQRYTRNGWIWTALKCIKVHWPQQLDRTRKKDGAISMDFGSYGSNGPMDR